MSLRDDLKYIDSYFNAIKKTRGILNDARDLYRRLMHKYDFETNFYDTEKKKKKEFEEMLFRLSEGQYVVKKYIFVAMQRKVLMDLLKVLNAGLELYGDVPMNEGFGVRNQEDYKPLKAKRQQLRFIQHIYSMLKKAEGSKRFLVQLVYNIYVALNGIEVVKEKKQKQPKKKRDMIIVNAPMLEAPKYESKVDAFEVIQEDTDTQDDEYNNARTETASDTKKENEDSFQYDEHFSQEENAYAKMQACAGLILETIIDEYPDYYKDYRFMNIVQSLIKYTSQVGQTGQYKDLAELYVACYQLLALRIEERELREIKHNVNDMLRECSF